MSPDCCPVTVRAGPSHSKNYENFVSNNLKNEVLKEITSNLEDTIKEEALAVFIDSVKGGFSIKDCIFKVQDEVLPNVPKERNKFFIKFTYDNQLQIEIGVNKFKNGNAQFYHKIGVAPKISPEDNLVREEKTKVLNKRRDAMQELRGAGGQPARTLKKQTTNDRSRPTVSGKVANPHGGWDEAVYCSTPPRPTNRQTARALAGWRPEDTERGHSTHTPRALGDLFQAKQSKPSQLKLRSKSVGRPSTKEVKPDISYKERSVSPAAARRGRCRGALGDCFQSGVRPSQLLLHPAVASPGTRRSSGGRPDISTSPRRESVQLSNDHIDKKHVKQNSFDLEELNDEWDESLEVCENENAVDKGYVSCEEKERIFLTETPTTMGEKCIIMLEPETENKSHGKEKIFENDNRDQSCAHVSQYPIKNLIRHGNSSNGPEPRVRRPRVQREAGGCEDGWHGPVVQRTRPAPRRGFGSLEVATATAPAPVRGSFSNMEGWVEIPIQRL